MPELKNSKYRSGSIGSLVYKLINSVLYFTPILLSNLKFRKSLLLPLYNKKEDGKNVCKEKTIVYMVQKETTFSGGLSDRLRGIVGIYAECKKQDLPFKLVFEPLHLQDYLEPNQYNWIIGEDEIAWNTKDVYPCTLLTYHADTNNRYQHFVQNTILKSYLRKPYKQIHVYSNMICKDEEYGPLFNELFKPSVDLQNQLDYHLSQIGGRGTYISCTFRFRQLLGDFKEGGDVLPEQEREAYILRAIHTVEKLHGENPTNRILVTADSGTFLNRVKELDYVYVIPGEVVHVGFTFDANKQTYMKSFVDMYMLSYASTVYLVRDELMYHSGFPYRAALLNSVEYKEINLS